MGYVYVTSACFGCGRLFCYNPHRVPSMRPTPTAEREPVCRSCMDWLNAERVKQGAEPIKIAADAYDAIPEYEL